MEDFRKMVSGGAEAGTGEAVADLNSSQVFLDASDFGRCPDLDSDLFRVEEQL